MTNTDKTWISLRHNRDRKISNPRKMLAAQPPVGQKYVLLKEGQSIDALSPKVLFFLISILIFSLKHYFIKNFLLCCQLL